jgi:hypothetical protein
MPEPQPEQKLCRRDREKLRKQALYKKQKENPEFVAKEKVRLRNRSREYEKFNRDICIFIPVLRECLGLDPRSDIWARQKNDHSTPMD